MINRYYILNKDKTTREAKDFEEFDSNMKENQIVKKTEIGKILISTVFLGVNHNYSGGEPILFETMIFNDDTEYEYQERYSTYQKALEGHKKCCQMIMDKYK